jgi:hypothetical protein
MGPCLYLNENADPDLKRMFEITFPDVPRVRAEDITRIVGDLTEGPKLAAYAAALVDENGELSLYINPGELSLFVPPRDA